MSFASWILLIIVLIAGFHYLLELTLDVLNLRTWKATLPDNLTGFYETDKEYKRAAQYSYDRMWPSLWSDFLGLLFFLFFLYYGGFNWIHELVSITDNSLLNGLLFFAVLGAAGMIAGIPFSYYSTFVIEERYGFNRSDKKTFVLDIVKGAILGGLLGGIAISIVLGLYGYLGGYAWLATWIVLGLLMFALQTLYATLIMPIFNKIEPLEEGDLRRSIEAYAKSVDFPLERIMVMDGSKRSSKANAMFTGIGKRKSIILYDTLIEKHTREELLSVLAHEVGHYKKKHIPVTMTLGLIQLGITLFLLFWFMGEPALSKAMGSNESVPYLGLIAFFYIYSPVSMITGIFMSILSRKNEYEADAFAAETSDGNAMIAALSRLSVTHLSNMHPHRAYVFFHYSHPPVLSRIEAIKALSFEGENGQ